MALLLFVLSILPWQWDHVPTYSCDPRAHIAIQDWGVPDAGCSPTPEIELKVCDPWPFGDRATGNTDIYAIGSTITHAVICIRPNVGQELITHEFGHALGLDHSQDPGDLMYYFIPAGKQISAGDRALMDTLWGSYKAPQRAELPYRVSVPMVAQ